jgi:hypothetical protein
MSHSLTNRIGIFYDGNFLFHVSNYYQIHHMRRQRLRIKGFHDFMRTTIANHFQLPVSQFPIGDAEYFRGRLIANEADDPQMLSRERVFDEVLINEGIRPHYMPMSRDGERGVDVAFAVRVMELSMTMRFNTAIIVACDGDYKMLIRSLVRQGIYVVIPVWTFDFIDKSGFKRETRVAKSLISEASLIVDMNAAIGEDVTPNKLIDNMFVIRRPMATSVSSVPEDVEETV